MKTMQKKASPRGTYKKHKEGSKITIKHYLNSKITIDLPDQLVHNPLYVQVIAKKRTIFFKSSIDTRLAPSDELSHWINVDDFGKKVISREAENIEKITQDLIAFDQDKFSINSVSQQYKGLEDFGDVVKDRLTEILCAHYDLHFGKDHKETSYDKYRGVHPLVLLNQWKEIPTIPPLLARFSTDIWDFDFYYGYFRNSAHRGQFVYASLIPNRLDYESGHLLEEMSRFYEGKSDTLKHVFSDLQIIMNSIII